MERSENERRILSRQMLDTMREQCAMFRDTPRAALSEPTLYLMAVLDHLKVLELEAQGTFEALHVKWKHQTKHMSSSTDIVSSAPYQRIIALGPVAIPFILESLRDEGPDHWWWALQCLTRTNPVRNEDLGDMEAMRQTWLRWGRENGYLEEGSVPE